MSLGVFDSGVGGLTIYRELARRFPKLDIIYLGDTARVPYGNRSPETIIKYALECASYLKSNFHINAFIVACNTISSHALKELEKTFSLPVLGVIRAGAMQALKITKNHKIGVIGTRATVNSNEYKNTLCELYPKTEVYQIACPLFVPLVEEGIISGDIPTLAVKLYLEGFKDTGIDTLILGCTHYPILRSLIEDFYPQWNIADSAACLCDTVEEWELANENGKREIMVTDDFSALNALKNMLVGNVKLQKIRL